MNTQRQSKRNYTLFKMADSPCKCTSTSECRKKNTCPCFTHGIACTLACKCNKDVCMNDIDGGRHKSIKSSLSIKRTQIKIEKKERELGLPFHDQLPTAPVCAVVSNHILDESNDFLSELAFQDDRSEYPAIPNQPILTNNSVNNSHNLLNQTVILELLNTVIIKIDALTKIVSRNNKLLNYKC